MTEGMVAVERMLTRVPPLKGPGTRQAPKSGSRGEERHPAPGLCEAQDTPAEERWWRNPSRDSPLPGTPDMDPGGLRPQDP